MAKSAALLVDEIVLEQPVRQWVLNFLYPLRFLFASCPAILGQVPGIVYRIITTHLVKKVDSTHKQDHPHRRGYADPALRQCAEPV